MTLRTANTNKERLLSREASGDITRRRFCKDVGANKVAQITVAGDKATSISRYGAGAGHAVSSQYGPSDDLVESGAAVLDNTEVMSDASGRAITFVAGGGAVALGKTRNSSSTAAGQVLSIQFYDSLTAHV